MVTVLASNVIDRGVNHIGGVMVTVLASNVIDRGVNHIGGVMVTVLASVDMSLHSDTLT
jgi:hypothetical protein